MRKVLLCKESAEAETRAALVPSDIKTLTGMGYEIVVQSGVGFKAGYTDDDITRLEAIWHTDYMPTKAHVGQLLLAGKEVPVPPSGARQTGEREFPKTKPAPTGAALKDAAGGKPGS